MRVSRFGFVAVFFLTGASAALAQVQSPIESDIVYPTLQVDPGQRYGRIRFGFEKMSVAAQQYWVEALVDKLFGFSKETEFIVALELKDDSKAGDDKLVASKVIAHFVRKPGGSSIFNTKVDVLNRMVLSGDLLRKVIVSERTNQFQLELQIYKSNNATLSESLLLTQVDNFNKAATIVHFVPVASEVLSVFKLLRDSALAVYKGFNAGSYGLITQKGMSFTKLNQSDPFARKVTFYAPYNPSKPMKTDAKGKPLKIAQNNAVAITVDFQTYSSSIAGFDEQTSKFSRPVWQHYATQTRLGPDDMNLTPFLLTRPDPVKSFVDGLVNRRKPQETKDDGKKVDKYKAEPLCSQIYDTLPVYLSAPDVAASYWAFLNSHSKALSDYPDGEGCYSQYANVLALYGLPAVNIGKTPPGAQPTPPVASQSEPAKIDPAAKTLKQIELAAKRGTAPESDIRKLQGIAPAK